jgi:membrane protein implicated in regulation of membrane protease activity
MMKPRLKDTSSTALLALAALFLAPGMLILSPDGRLFFLALAGLVSAVVVIAAPSGQKRLFAGIALVIAVVMALQAWPEYRAHADARKKQTSRPAKQADK